MDDFLKECVDALGSRTTIIEDKSEADLIVDFLAEMFPVASWGRIDWQTVKHQLTLNAQENICAHIINEDIDYLNELYRKQLIGSEEKLLSHLKSRGKENFDDVYIIWFDASLPILKCDLKTILDNIYDVVTVSCDTWLYSLLDEWVIELDHDGNVRLGFADIRETKPSSYRYKRFKGNKR